MSVGSVSNACRLQSAYVLSACIIALHEDGFTIKLFAPARSEPSAQQPYVCIAVEQP